MTFLLFSILMYSKKTSAFLVSNNLTLRLKGICVIFFLINWLGWGHLSILIIKKGFKKKDDACCVSVNASVASQSSYSLRDWFQWSKKSLRGGFNFVTASPPWIDRMCTDWRSGLLLSFSCFGDGLKLSYYLIPSFSLIIIHR